MDDNFFKYLERLELMGFFVAYPLVYLIIYSFLSGSKNQYFKKAPLLLPFAYALVGTLFLGLQLKNLYPDYSIDHIKSITLLPYLKIWGLTSLLFWIPVIAKKPILSLLHSLVFFYFLALDLYLTTFKSLNKEVIQNDMRVFTDSFLLNIGAFILIYIATYFIRQLKRQERL